MAQFTDTGHHPLDSRKIERLHPHLPKKRSTTGLSIRFRTVTAKMGQSRKRNSRVPARRRDKHRPPGWLERSPVSF